MKQKYFKLVMMLAAVTMFAASCADDDDTTPSAPDVNYFAVADGDNSEEAVMRRSFFENTGVYLLFNDTLRHEYVGKDAFGDDVYDTEVIDFNYNFTDYGLLEMKVERLETIGEKRDAMAFVEQYVMPHLGAGKLRPYSIYIISSLQLYDSWDYAWNNSSTMSCFRSLAIAAGGVNEMSEEEKQLYAAEICRSIVSARIDAEDSSLEPFNTMCEDYFYQYLEDIIDGWYDDEHTKDEALAVAHEYGFLNIAGRSWFYFPNQTDDFAQYLNLVLTKSEEEVEAEYGDYPLIISRYMILRNIIVSLGYIF